MSDGKTFLQLVADHDAAGRDLAPTLNTTVNTAGGDNPAWVQAAYHNEITTLANTAKGARNAELNNTALKLARLPVDRHQLRSDLHHACTTNGLADDDGQKSVHATIDSAFRKADLDGPRDIPEPRIDSSIIDSIVIDNTNTDDEKQDLHQLAVRRRAYELRINDDARQLYASQQAEQLGQARPRPILLNQMLAAPDEDAKYRITDLLPTGGRALLAAQQKAGKTSMIANLIRALVDGGNFLEKFPLQPVQRLTLIDNELDERMLRRWLRDQNVRNTQRVQIITLRGKTSTFDILNDHTRAQWADDIRGSQFIILDCLRPCLDALGLSEDKDAGRFLIAWDALMHEAGADETVVVHHMGHRQERSRGDSRLLDWPDVNWKIIKESQNENTDTYEYSDSGRRYFSANGRDVDISEGLLKWDSASRALTYINGGRRESKAIDAIDAIREIMAADQPDGIGIVALTNKLQTEGIGKTIARRAIKKAIEGSVLLESSGPRNSKILILNPSEAR